MVTTSQLLYRIKGNAKSLDNCRIKRSNVNGGWNFCNDVLQHIYAGEEISSS